MCARARGPVCVCARAYACVVYRPERSEKTGSSLNAVVESLSRNEKTAHHPPDHFGDDVFSVRNRLLNPRKRENRDVRLTEDEDAAM